MCPGFSAKPVSGTWCARCVPSMHAVHLFGPVQPLGERSTIMGQRRRRLKPSARASTWMARMASSEVSSAEAISPCISAGSSPDTKRGS
jgi:hypothetical protein